LHAGVVVLIEAADLPEFASEVSLALPGESDSAALVFAPLAALVSEPGNSLDVVWIALAKHNIVPNAEGSKA
jgi:hypothetical protein